jgi:alkyl sulfatase BDS1-like metallo-beta-lactamase superfamily hydrolase
MARKKLKLFLVSIIIINTFTIFTHVTEHTRKINKKVLKALPFDSSQDFEDAARGFIAPLPDNGIIKDNQNNIVWNLSQYDFLKKETPPNSVNPSLWRQAKLLHYAGLFKVTDNIYQIRGADISNMTIIEAQNSIIVVDPLLSVETARTALELYYQNRPKKPLSAIIYTHSHVDHFGGVKGVVTQEEVDSGKVKIIAPEGFAQAVLDENIIAGNAMKRRASYMYGNLLDKSPEGQITSGLGLTSSTGRISFISPTEYITKTGQEKIIHGVKFIFLLALDSEAPSEMIFYLPQFKALDVAENATHTMHNIYTLRGAKIRDAKAWANYINQTIEMFGSKAEVVFAQHHWPIWGKTRIIEFLEKQRDMYKYLHDQTLRLANQGYTMLEIGEMVKLPKCLAQEWYNQGYYGSESHNTKAIYNFYLGWFDGNPSTLHQLPPVQASEKYLEYMGGSKKVLENAKKDYENGNYRWVAQVLNHVVFAEPHNKKARELLANTLEQLGYQTQNGTWRNFYLTGAQELRYGIDNRLSIATKKAQLTHDIPTQPLLDYLAISINGPKAADHHLVFNLEFPDMQEQYLIEIKNGVLHHYQKDKITKNIQSKVIIERKDFLELISQKVTLNKLINTKKIKLHGSKKIFITFLSLMDNINTWFNIIEPKNS